MKVVRLFTLIIIVILSMGSLNYLFSDKLSIVYIVSICLFVLSLCIYGNKLCLNYFKATELTRSEDEELANIVKSAAYIRSMPAPEIYQFKSKEQGVFLLESLSGWSLLLSDKLLLSLDSKHKELLIKDIFVAKKKNTFYLRSFGMTIQILLLNLVQFGAFKYRPLKLAIGFFITPVLRLIDAISNTKFTILMSPLLDEYILKSHEYFNNLGQSLQLLSVLREDQSAFERFVDHDLFLSARTRTH